MIRTVALEQIAHINPRPPKELADDDLVSFIPMAAISEDGQIVAGDERIARVVRKGFTYFQRGDFLLAKITPCFENGKAALTSALPHEHGFGSTEFHVIRAHSGIADTKYLSYLLRSNEFRFLGKQSMYGAAGQQRVGLDFIKQYPVFLPPLKEQRRIAAILDKADAIRRKQQRAIELTETFLRSVFLDMFGDPVTNPKEWDSGTIEDVVNDSKSDIRCGPFGTQLKVHELVSDGVPLLGIQNVFDDFFVDSTKKFLTHQKSKQLDRFDAIPGDVLITRMGTIGRACVIPKSQIESRISYHLFRIRTDKDRCLPEFLASTISRSGTFQAQLKRLAHGAIMDGLSTSILKGVKFLLPPIKMQRSYVAIVKKTEETLSRLNGQLDKEEDLFGSLTQNAFRGELTQSTTPHKEAISA